MSTTAAMETRMETVVSGSSIATEIVVCLGPWYTDAASDHLQPLLDHLLDALGPRAGATMVAYPVSDPQAGSWKHEGLSLQPYQPAGPAQVLHIQPAATYLSLFEIMRAHNASCGLLLGPEGESLAPAAIGALLDAILLRNADLALPRYSIGPNESLINASILHPLTRSLFGVKASFPLALDMALSKRAAEKMAEAAQRYTASGQPDSIVWPTAEAAISGFTVAEVGAGVRDLPQSTDDLSSILSAITSSLFSEVEAKATFWQRTRPVPSLLALDGAPHETVPGNLVPPEEIAELIESFRIGYGNLHEIWSLVLPPQTLLGLKRLSRLTEESFAMPDALWVRILYDFVLAHRLRTINRGHLLGSLAPLYLAWVASHILATQAGASTNPPEALARAFEADKPYLVSRWRWPDRFNP